MSANIIGVKFQNGEKTYYFSGGDYTFQIGDFAIVETTQALDIAKVVAINVNIEKENLENDIKEVIRKATEEDLKAHKKNNEQKSELMAKCEEKIKARKLEMKLLDVYYTFDRKKLIVLFTSEHRVDFRELLKDLASEFHVRIELKQFYKRELIQILGSVGTCGCQCCCSRFLKNPNKVTVKMAKNQNLVLNPTKINGMCGKLMCCLDYENKFYTEINKKLPNKGEKVITPDGEGTVYSTQALKQCIGVKMEDKDGNIDVHIYHIDEIKFEGKIQNNSIDDEDDGEMELFDIN